MVPRFCSNSAAFMPIPLSEMVSVDAAGSTLIWIFRSPVRPFRMHDGFEAALVERVGGVRDELAQKHLFVAVKRVDDRCSTWLTLGLEGMGRSFAHVSSRVTASKLVTLQRAVNSTGSRGRHSRLEVVRNFRAAGPALASLAYGFFAGSGMSPSSSPGTLGNRPACHHAWLSMRASELDTKFHSTYRGPSGGAPPRSRSRESTSARTDGAPPG